MSGGGQRKGRRPWGLRLPVFAEGSFAWNLSFTSGRSLVTILAQVALTPVIVRLYDPEAYGSFGVVLSLTALLLPVVTLKYEKAILLARQEEDLLGVRAVSNALAFFFSLLVLVLLLVARGPLLGAIGAEGLGNAVFLVPLLVLLSAWAQNSQLMVAARNRYKEGFLYGSGTVVVSKLAAIAYGVFVGNHFLGLVLTEMLNRSLNSLVNVRFILGERRLLKPDHFRIRPHWRVLRKYVAFPKYELPANVVRTFSGQIPVFWIPASFGLAAFGQLALSLSLLEMPMRLFGYSISNTFYQKAAVVHERDGRAALASITFRTMAAVALASFVPLLLLGLFATPVFVFFLGEAWAVAGSLSSVLAVFYFARLVVEPVSTVLRVIGEQRALLRFQLVLLLFRLAAWGGAAAAGYGLVGSIALYSAASTVAYILLTAHVVRSLRACPAGGN